MTDGMINGNAPQVSAKRLWFGFAGAAVAWTLAGFLTVFFAGKACPRPDAGVLMSIETWLRVLLGLITFGLLAVAILAGMTSFRNWRRLSRQHDFVEAEGRGREEFMALFGVMVSASLGLGILWFVLPVYIIRLCARAH